MNTFATLIGGVGKHVHSSAGMRSRALWLARSKEPRGGGRAGHKHRIYFYGLFASS